MKDENTTELSGHVHGHLQHMQAKRGPDGASHAAVFDAIQILAPMRFHLWSDSKAWKQRGMNQLQKSLRASSHADGSPKDGTAALQERLWTALLAQAVLLANNETLSKECLRSLGQSLQFLVDLSGPCETIPLFGEAPLHVTRNGFEPMLSTMAHLAHLWMGIDCPRPDGPDPLLRQMNIETPRGNPWLTPRYWTAHNWTSGVAVAHNPIHRIICRAADQSVWWSMGGHTVLHGSAVNGNRDGHIIRSVRTDDRVFSADLDGLQIRFEGRRLTISGGPLCERQRWYFPAGTHIQHTDKGFCASNPHGTIEITASKEWSIGEDCIIAPAKRASQRLRFEHRSN